MEAVVRPLTTQGNNMMKPRLGDTKEYATPPIRLISRAELLEPKAKIPKVKMAANMAWFAWFRNDEK